MNNTLTRAATVLGVTASMVGGSLLLAPAAAAADNACGVTISGGTVSNTTTIDVSANGGTGIGDASGGSNNVAFDNVAGGVASSGNGGVASAAANGGAVSLGDVNSGGNAGNAISVGNTNCAPPPAKPVAPKPEMPKPQAPKAAAAAPAKAVKALPATGVGELGAGLGGVLAAFSALSAAAGLGLRRRG